MVLLTQSQVSVLISGTILSLFTFALFLSGYVLQQRTITDIRAAIRPSVQNFAVISNLPPLNEVSSDHAEHIPQDVNGRTAGTREGEHKGDFLAEYYDKDAERQEAQEKLPYVLDSNSSPASPSDGQISHKLNYLASLQTRGFAAASLLMQTVDRKIHKWIRRIQGRELEDWEQPADWDESTPIEELTANQRRRRIKMDIRRLGVVEDGELRAVYRPRKRTGKAS